LSELSETSADAISHSIWLNLTIDNKDLAMIKHKKSRLENKAAEKAFYR
jgi:hypothetical protein